MAIPGLTCLARHVAVLAFALAGAAPAALAQQPALRGVVVDSATSAPLQGVRVQTAAAITFTDERGRFRLVVRDSGAVAVTVSRIGYAPRRLQLAAGPTQRLAYDIAMVALGLPLDPVIVTASRQSALALSTPAAVTIVDREQIDERAALGIIEHVRTTPGMDLASKGLIQHAYAVRGLRGSVSGALLTLTDYRYAEVPALALNIPYLFAPTSDDLERIEIVRGPGAALYGPGADRGVLHFITRSPFESPGASITLTGGGRSLWGATGRWAGLLGRHVAIKLSADYVHGTDWPYSDSVENTERDSALAQGADPDTLRIARREPDLDRLTTEARLDWRPTTHTEVSATAGRADAIKAIDLGGDVGSVQARHWRYRFAQLRVRERRLQFGLAYNISNTGDSYLLRTGGILVDSSRVVAAQVQHGVLLGSIDLLYGADLRWTDPRTGGTINGEHEDDDRMAEAGAYLHGTVPLTTRTDLTAALRVDHHSRLNDLVFSPRVGLVFRPTVGHALRVTFNHGFTSPDANTLFLDLPLGQLDTLPYFVRASSMPQNGYTFRRDCGGLCMTSPYGAPGPLPIEATSVWAALFPPGIPAPPAGQVGMNLAAFDLDTSFIPVAAASVTDIPALRRTITTSVEVGWRAMFGRRFGFDVDVFVNRVNDVLGSRYVATPSAFLDSASLATYLGNFMSAAQAASAAAQAARLPVGTVSPQQTSHPADLLVLSRQGGSYTLWGIDVGLDIPISRRITARGEFSWLSRDSATVSSAPGQYMLNVPKRKGALGLTWHEPRGGHEVGVEGRWVAGFPVNTGVYVGNVPAYGVLDAHLTVPVPFARRTTLMLQANNLLDNRHQEFVGAPALGRLLFVRASTAF